MGSVEPHFVARLLPQYEPPAATPAAQASELQPSASPKP
jgi:hypothetical protein